MKKIEIESSVLYWHELPDELKEIYKGFEYRRFLVITYKGNLIYHAISDNNDEKIRELAETVYKIGVRDGKKIFLKKMLRKNRKYTPPRYDEIFCQGVSQFK